MPVVKMPTGELVDLPDQLSSDQATRLRAFNDDYVRRKAGAMALEGMSGTEKFLAGAGKGITDVGRGIAQVAGFGDQQAIDEAKARDSALSGSGAGMAGEISGNLALTALPGVGLQSGITRAAATVLPRLAPFIGAAGAGGAISGITNPVASDESRLRSVGYGAAGGAAGEGVGRLAARIAQPITRSPSVDRLLSEGVVPTPGQAVGADSVPGRIEQKLTSVLGVGDIIKSGRDRARTEFEKAALNRSMPGGQVSQAGLAGLQESETALSHAYDMVFRGKTVQPNADLARVVNDAKQAPLLPLNEASQKTFDSVLKKVMWDRIPTMVPSTGGSTLSTSVSTGGMAPGAVLTMPADRMKQEIIGDLGKVARDHLDSPIAAEKALGQALMEARNSVQAWLAGEVSKTSPQAATQIAMIDRAYANKVAVAKATERAKAWGGRFTPNQLQSVTRPGQPLRELANDAQSVMGSTVPNSGTVDRALITAALAGGGEAANAYFGGPGYLSALLATPLLYSRTGSRYMVGGFPGQGKLADLLRSASPIGAQIGRATADQKQ